MFPTADSTNVPENTRVWIQLDCSDAGLLDHAGAKVPLADDATIFTSGLLGIRVLTPVAPLTQGDLYQVWCDGPTVFSFRPNEDADQELPPTPHLNHYIDTDDAVALEATEPFDVLLVDIDGAASFAPEDMAGDVSATFYNDVFATIGDTECFKNYDFDEGGDASVRFAALDLAGNFSGWSEPMLVEEPGCAIGSRGALPSSSWLVSMATIAGLGALVGRRSRRLGARLGGSRTSHASLTAS